MSLMSEKIVKSSPTRTTPGAIQAVNLALGAILFGLALFSVLQAADTVFGPGEYIGILIGATGLLSFWTAMTPRRAVLLGVNAGVGILYAATSVIGALMHWQIKVAFGIPRSFTGTSAELLGLAVVGAVFLLNAYLLHYRWRPQGQ
jgi:hypothetical protein